MSDDPHPSSIDTSLSAKLFLRDMAGWSKQRSTQGLRAGGKSVYSAGFAIEHAKQLIISSLRSRDSKLGRPYSPFGVGGLTAVIGLSGLLFGHNGVVNDQHSADLIAPVVQAKAANQVALVNNDLMVDTADLHTIIPSDRLRDSVITHKVESGENLEKIAKEFNVSVDSLRYVNNLSSQDHISPGQNLTILPISGVLHEVKKGETLQSIADAWKVPVQGIVDVNWLDEPYTVVAGQKLVIPGAEIPKPTPTPDARKKSAPSRGLASAPVRGNGMFIWPVAGHLTQNFSYYHNGIDIGTGHRNLPIVAAGSGVVTFAGWWAGGGGYSVWIDHGNGYVTMYAHLSRIMVGVGQRVSQGQQIGLTGETGRAFGIHLHFMVERNHKVINPLSVL